MHNTKAQNVPRRAPSPRLNLMGKATAELRGEGHARFIAVAIAKNRTIQPLTPVLSPLAELRANVARRRGEGAGCGLAWDFGLNEAGL